MSRPRHVQRFIDFILPTAQMVRNTYSLPVPVTIIQAAVETGWGRFVRGNAYWGIKGSTLHGTTALMTTTEVRHGRTVVVRDRFRQYNTLEDAARDYARFITTNRIFRPALHFISDPIRFAQQIGQHWATDPTYTRQLLAGIRNFNLFEYHTDNGGCSLSFPCAVA